MATSWQIGDRIQNRWEIHNILGGGLGVIYIVYDHELREVFAAKTFREELFARNPAIAERFMQESLAWIRLDLHQNVTNARMIQEIRGKPFLFLEYVNGGDLSAWIKASRQNENVPQVLHLAIQFCDGMSHALSKGIIAHRDIKPQNCLLTEDGTLKVTDFGLAKIFNDARNPDEQNNALGAGERGLTGALKRVLRRRQKRGSADAATSATGDKYQGLTYTGAGMGTPRYMAPEQFDSAKAANVRTDIYSFGVMLFEMLTGQLPFDGRERSELKRQHQTLQPPLSLVRDGSLREVVERCLAKAAGERFGNFAEVRQRLAEIYEELTDKRAPRPATGLQMESAHLVNKGLSLDMLGRLEEALGCYDRAIELDARNAIAWNNKGYTLGREGHYEEALVCLDRAVELDPGFERAWMNKGLSLRRSQRVEEALACYDRVLKLNPRNADAWNNKGAALGYLGWQEEELACFTQAVEIDPNNLQARLNKALVLAGLGRWREALTVFDPIGGLESDTVASIEQLLAPHVPPHDATEFEQNIKRLHRQKGKPVTQAHDEAAAWIKEGVDYATSGQYDNAVSMFERALKIDPEIVEAWNNKGIALRELGRPEEALTCHNHVLTLDPQFADGWNDKGGALLALGRSEEAIACYDRAIEISPRHEKAWYNRGNLFFDLGRVEDAIRCYERSLELNPQNASAWYNTGLLRRQQGQYAEALACFERTLAIDPRHQKALVNKVAVLAYMGR